MFVELSSETKQWTWHGWKFSFSELLFSQISYFFYSMWSYTSIAEEGWDCDLWQQLALNDKQKHSTRHSLWHFTGNGHNWKSYARWASVFLQQQTPTCKGPFSNTQLSKKSQLPWTSYIHLRHRQKRQLSGQIQSSQKRHWPWAEPAPSPVQIPNLPPGQQAARSCARTIRLACRHTDSPWDIREHPCAVLSLQMHHCCLKDRSQHTWN